MKFVSSQVFQTVTDALNFSTADCHVIGSCDLYTTKAAGSDKKLYKNIESSLESQHDGLVRLAASLSPPQIPVDGRARKQSPAYGMPQIDLSRESPFGSLDRLSARRTFMYLIATLNASHPDYDFSNILRPTDFQKTTGTSVRRIVDSTLQNMRPRRMISLLAPPSHAPLSNSAPVGQMAPSAGTVWSEHMWKLVDQEMDLRHCEKYTWDPEDDPFEAESALWSQHYFFFNREKKRVCYLHFRAFSAISHSPVRSAAMTRARPMPRSASNISVGKGAGKRAQYWLGHSVDDDDVDSWHEDDDDEMVLDNDYADEEYTQDYDDFREKLEDGYYSYGGDATNDADVSSWYGRGRSVPRATSEGLADAMEL